MKIQTRIEKINPLIAEQMIATNVDHNRRIMQSHVLHLAQQMEYGQWKTNGESIVFDDHGRIIDGQHRLRAIIKSGYEGDFLVVRGVDSQAFHTIDRGRVRGNAALFQISGEINSCTLAACTSAVLNYRRARKSNDGKGGSLNSYIRASGEDLLNEYYSHKDVYDKAAHIANQCKKTCAQSISSTIYSLSRIDAGHSEPECDYFWDKVSTGAELGIDDPIRIFRERLSDNAKTRAKLSQNMLIVIGIKAWNAYVKGTPCKLLRVMKNEPCPEIL